ncbi:hypothetical protein GCM10010967_32320 [Dyadobacter beijingensis]|uniref:HTH araC/xylS-type domain-containing protein n=1 Tax=Dyadobacter beijingensis TaxID=365489 RepID=A0ABQ2I250_9BACT|nr:helix-turn-helix domain-containing protein [Dyadobacter beijingensis]GGM96275.1 hypothetical protein GCM10010967_32320 [Dyadobacter beijingensis]
MHLEFEPPEALRDAVKCFWYDSKEYGDAVTGFEVVPDGYAEIIFHFGSLWGAARQGGLQALPSPFMIGLLNRPVHFTTQNRLEIIGVRCYPWTVFELLGLPSDQERVRVFEHPVAGLHPVLAECIRAGHVDAAIGQVSGFFTDARARVAIDSLLFKAGNAMQAANGTLPVNRVAAAAHATVRTLERKFKESSGHTVKDVSALMRFEQARNHLWLHPDANLAGLAHDLGYTDQSHLSREFKRFTGTTPAAFARKARQGPHKSSDDFVAFVQA